MQPTRRRSFFARLLRVVGVVAAAGMVAVTSLRWIDPLTSSVILQGNFFNDEQHAPASFDWRPLAQVSTPMALAVIAAEDQRFLQHHGLDLVELAKTLRAQSDRPRGASTITQQTAKNLFLWSGRSYPRKVLEAALAFYIDLVWGKRRVLEIYLNVAQFGPGIYGVENAARHFFNQGAADLNRHQAARLAAVLPNPRYRSLAAVDAQVVRRQRWILRQMQALGGEGLLHDLR